MTPNDLYKMLRTGTDGTGPPTEIWEPVEAVLEGIDPEAAYTEAVERDGNREIDWTVWTITDDVLLRVTGTSDRHRPDTTVADPEAVWFPIRITALTAKPYSQTSPVWSATLVGPDGDPLTLHLPSPVVVRWPGQRAAAHKFALALRDQLRRAASVTSG